MTDDREKFPSGNISKKVTGDYPLSLTDVIRARTSVRTYAARPLDKGTKGKLDAYLVNLKGPFNVETRFKLVDSTLLWKEEGVKIGTYGIIRGATTFIAAAVKKEDKNMEELGYLFEKAVLYATSLGLGTCWLGGTFKKGEFAKAIKLGEDEILPVVSPVGYRSENKSMIESIMRFAAGSKKRKGWDELFFHKSFSRKLDKAEAGEYTLPLEMLRLAPSASNKQPWCIVKDGGKYHFYLQHAKGYSNALGYDIQRIDIGIAMCHFGMTAEEVGLAGEWKTSDPGISELPANTEYIVSWFGK